MTSLNSARLHLRRFNAKDFDNLFELESNPDIMKFTPMRTPRNRDQTLIRLQALLDQERARAPLGVWAVETKESKDFVGWFMLLKRDSEYPELGFMIVQRHWGKGYATEAAACLVSYAFNVLAFSKLVAATDQTNEVSKAVLRKLGFTPVENKDQLDFFELKKQLNK